MKKISYILRLYRKMGRIDRGFLPNLAALVILDSLHPLNGVYFLYYIVRSLETGLNLRAVSLGLCLMGGIELLYYLAMKKLRSVNRVKSMNIRNQLALELQQKTIRLPFQELENPLWPRKRKLSYFQELATNFSYAKEVRLYAMGGWIVSKMKGLTSSYIKGIRKSVLHFSLVGILSSLLLVLGTGISFLRLGQLTWLGVIHAADFVSCVNVVRTFEASMVRAVEAYMTIGQAMSYLQAYWQYMDFPESPRVPRTGQRLLPPGERAQGEIRFEHVSFRYPGAEDYTLKDVTFCIKPGEKVALVGENGSGKTTIIKLLLRLYRPEEGKIYWNGLDISTLALSDYRKAVTAVFQDFKILEDTARNNLCFSEQQPEERIWEVLEETGMREKVQSLPLGLDSYLGKTMYEGGQELSGGEKQKLAIARVLLRDAGMVVMDEPTAMLSPRVEYEIYTHFSQLVKGRSAIYISHRMSSCRFCDWIMVLSGGVIREKGTHEELMALDGEYCGMYTAQAKFYEEIG